MTPRRLAAAVVGAVALWVGAAAGAGAADAPRPPVAWPALPRADGGTLAPETLRGQPLVVVFWATWCGFCERHNARIEKLHRLGPDRAPRVIGVAIDGSVDSVGRHARSHGWSFPVVLDDGALRRQFTPRRIVPMTCLVAADGRVRQCIPGEMSEDDVLGLASFAAR